MESLKQTTKLLFALQWSECEEKIMNRLEPSNTLSRTASWVIKDKTNGAVLFETFNPQVVERLNTKRYEAVPILQYLQELNREIRNGHSAQ